MKLNPKFIQNIKVFFSAIIILILLQSCNSHLVQDNKSAKIVYYQKKLLHKCSETRPLSKLAYAERFEGDSERRSGTYLNNVREDSSTESTLKSPAEVEFQKRSNNQMVLVGGCFDLLHYGHIQFLREAKAQGNYLIVALEPDETIVNYKKRQPIHNQLQRADALGSLRFVDEVVMLPSLKGFDDYNQLVQDVCPSVIAVTANDPQLKNKQRQAKLIGAKVVEVIDLVKNQGVGTLSNTVIINKLLE